MRSRGSRDIFYKVVEAVKRDGFCISCWQMSFCKKSGLKTLTCTKCKTSVIIERDRIIQEWYVIDECCGERKLKSSEIFADNPYWLKTLRHIRTIRRKSYTVNTRANLR